MCEFEVIATRSSNFSEEEIRRRLSKAYSIIIAAGSRTKQQGTGPESLVSNAGPVDDAPTGGPGAP